MKDFYIDFTEYSEEVAKVLYEEVQKHAFELGYKWCRTGKTLEKYSEQFHVLIFQDMEMSVWVYPPTDIKNKVSVEEFLKMEKEPEYHVGMPVLNDLTEGIALYLDKEGSFPVGFTGIALKHSWDECQYATNGYYDPCFWKPIDPSRIKVTIK